MRPFVIQLLVVSSIVSICKAGLNTMPSNQVTKIHSQTTFGCSTSDTSGSYYYYPSWIYYSIDSSINCTLVIGGHDSYQMGTCTGFTMSRYGVYKSYGTLNLIIGDTWETDAGTYVCIDFSKYTTAGAVFGAIVSDPSIYTNTSETVIAELTPVEFTCKVSYNGSNAMPLIIKWTNAYGTTVYANSTTNSSRLFQSVIVVEATSTAMFPYSCTVTFDPPTYLTVDGTQQATNKPSFTQTTQSATFTVLPLPDPPTSVLALAVSTTELDVDWTAVKDATYYRLTCSDPYLSINVPADNNATHYTLTGLTPGQTYTVLVESCVLSSCSRFTSATNNTFPADPGSLQFTGSSSTSLTVTWEQLGVVDSYTIYVNYDLTFASLTNTNSTKVTAYITELPPATTTYCLSVTAISGQLHSNNTVGCICTDGSDDTLTIVFMSLFIVFCVATIGLTSYIVWQKCRNSDSQHSQHNSRDDSYQQQQQQQQRQQQQRRQQQQQQQQPNINNVAYIDAQNYITSTGSNDYRTIYEEIANSNRPTSTA